MIFRHPTPAACGLALLLSLSAVPLSAQKPAEKKNSHYWGELTEAQQAAAIETQKSFIENAARKTGVKLLALESDYFHFATDLEKAEAAKWYRLLDKMYERLLKMFSIPRKTNIWHGKATVFVFKNRADFFRYEQKVEGVNATGAAGLCHYHGPLVRIAFYRQPDEAIFAQVLVHESVHGFVHRYRAPHLVPSWVNEGLAEWIAYELVPKNRTDKLRLELAKKQLEAIGGGSGKMFELDHIEGWQYGYAYGLTDFMISNNRRGYVKFFNALKDGQPVREAMTEHYGIDFERLVAAYGKKLGLKALLRP